MIYLTISSKNLTLPASDERCSNIDGAHGALFQARGDMVAGGDSRGV